MSKYGDQNILSVLHKVPEKFTVSDSPLRTVHYKQWFESLTSAIVEEYPMCLLYVSPRSYFRAERIIRLDKPVWKIKEKTDVFALCLACDYVYSSSDIRLSHLAKYYQISESTVWRKIMFIACPLSSSLTEMVKKRVEENKL